jgi:hypothetical protein
LFYDRVEGKRLTPQIELVKSVEIFCGLTTDRNWPHVLALIIEGFKDPSQIRSTRKIMKVMFKLAQSPENMISQSFYIEKLAAELTQANLEQTNTGIQSKLLKSFTTYISHAGSQNESRRVILDLVKMLDVDLESVGEHGVLNIIDSAVVA